MQHQSLNSQRAGEPRNGTRGTKGGKITARLEFADEPPCIECIGVYVNYSQAKQMPRGRNKHPSVVPHCTSLLKSRRRDVQLPPGRNAIRRRNETRDPKKRARRRWGAETRRGGKLSLYTTGCKKKKHDWQVYARNPLEHRRATP